MEKVNYYPLSPAQHLMFYAYRFSIHKQLMNIPTSCLKDTLLDMALLKQAVAASVQRHDVFGIRITKVDKQTRQYFSDRAVLTLGELDFTGQSAAAMDKRLHQIGAKATGLYDKPLASLYLIKTPDGKSGVFTVICHLIMDSWAITQFYKDIWDVYDALLIQAPPPKALPSYEAMLQKELDYQTSAQHDLDRAFWSEEIAGAPAGSPVGPPPISTHVNGSIMLEKYRKFKRKPDYRFGRGISLRTTARHAVHMVSAADMAKMTAFCQTNRIATTQVLFTLGVRLYLAKVNQREQDISFHLISARRGTLVEKLCSGTRVHPLILRTIMAEQVTFAEAIDQLREKQHAMFRHPNLSPLEMFALMSQHFAYSPLEGYSALHLTFQPVPLIDRNGVSVSTWWYCNGTAASAIGLSIMDGDATGALRCYYEYQDHQIKPETIARFHTYMIQVILAGIANPNISLKNLLDLPV